MPGVVEGVGGPGEVEKEVGDALSSEAGGEAAALEFPDEDVAASRDALVRQAPAREWVEGDPMTGAALRTPVAEAMRVGRVALARALGVTASAVRI